MLMEHCTYITGAGKSIYDVLCERITPEQNSIIRRQAAVNSDVFMNLLTWFFKESGDKGNYEVIPPDKSLNPVVFIQEDDSENSTD